MSDNRGVYPPDPDTEDGLGVIYGLMCKCHPEAGIRYVGQTGRKVETRLYQHIWEATRAGREKTYDFAVYRWIRKHEGRNIEPVILESNQGRHALNDLEALWIDRLKTFKDFGGLNLTSGGGAGSRLSNDSRLKMSRAWTPERKEAHRKRVVGRVSPQKGVPLPEETRRKISEAKKGKKRNPESSMKSVKTRLERGSHAGSNNGRALISEKEAQEIYVASWAQLGTLEEIASKFGVDSSVVQRIKYRKNWVRATNQLAMEMFGE